MTDPTPARLSANGVSLSYDDHLVVDRLDLDIPDGKVTTIIGPNACGKSTLLRALARLLKPSTGQVVLDGELIHKLPTKEVARRLGLLPQTPIAPEGITVVDLVARGRTPHQRLFHQWSQADEAAVRTALDATSTADLADRSIDELSGGQRQRVWIAMALAQETELLLLDEPTTFLDIAHQIDVLDLVEKLNTERGRTVVVVLHDLNLACRYADHIVAMRDGAIVAAGRPADVINADTVRAVFGLESVVIDDPISGTPLVVPISSNSTKANRSPALSDGSSL
ncbi:ABC transporter ATP-binding protein [Ilumatobacter coccineus]|uniref:Iron siderophore ABC transporter ATP-binding protein n=1 Tax=Ilumatobacter coccineus (strain NBRC 103263 / KCTC 29153 / YM16-304) TaxID=1313172 RepID=A0A6C7ECF9_ILUCY|nr:ABC transporter ATP-binding protein [Ilumatobacter coccineus]BAN04447.1 iron siderophore ABC transporter ATP-binding protein [Ilumatobacter coccineus YM16-304]